MNHPTNPALSGTVAALVIVSLAGIVPRQTVHAQTTKPGAMTIEETDQPAGLRVLDASGKLFAGYVVDSNGKPVVYPLVGPSGAEMTRRHPIDPALPSEKQDHPHHRSMWMTHGEVNGVDFWAEGDSTGSIVQTEVKTEVTADGKAIIQTNNDWMTPDGKRVLSDTRRFTFFTAGDRRIVDCDFLLKATDGDVNFGDTKEGSFGIRVAGTMKVDAKLGGIVTNAEGQNNKDAWGQKSAWVDYSGPATSDVASADSTSANPTAANPTAANPASASDDAKQTVGITIHDHPSSFGYPCRWHVRTYGLFAANPFGVHHFTGGDPTSGVVLKDGSQMRLNYRVVLHDGPVDAGQAAEDSKQFANDPRPSLE